MFEGVFVPNVTPFLDGSVDEASLRRLVDYLIEEGISGLVPCGTTGESATLSHEEHVEVIKIVANQAAGRVPVIAGVGTNDTRETKGILKGVDALDLSGYLVVGPYYNRPSQEGIIEHYRAISGETEKPILIYNIPSRTGRNIEVGTIANLSRIPNIVGVKDASGDICQTMDIIAQTQDDFTVLSGEDYLMFLLSCLGGKGGIMASAHVVPGKFLSMYEMVKEGRPKEARELHYQLLPLMRTMFREPNPAPVKCAMKLLGIIESDELRLPMMRVSASLREDISGVLHAFGLI